MIDCFLVESPATSIAFSPTGDVLASTHVDDLGIYLWSNKSLYSHVSLRPLPSDFTPSLLELPTTRAPEETRDEEKVGGEREGKEDGVEASTHSDTSEPPTPLGKGLVTLSSLPKSRWYNLQHLDVIKVSSPPLVVVLILTACILHPLAIPTLQQHNKPVEPPKQLRPAPFFLPTLPGLQPKFIPEEEALPASEASASKIVNLGKLRPLSEFQKCLLQCAGTKECE